MIKQVYLFVGNHIHDTPTSGHILECLENFEEFLYEIRILLNLPNEVLVDYDSLLIPWNYNTNRNSM